MQKRVLSPTQEVEAVPFVRSSEWERYCWPHTAGISCRHTAISVWPSSWILSKMPPSTFLKEQSSVCLLLRPLFCETCCVFNSEPVRHTRPVNHKPKPFQTRPLTYPWQNLHPLGVRRVSYIYFSKHCVPIGGFCLCILQDKHQRFLFVRKRETSRE